MPRITPHSGVAGAPAGPQEVVIAPTTLEANHDPSRLRPRDTSLGFCVSSQCRSLTKSEPTPPTVEIASGVDPEIRKIRIQFTRH